MAWINSPGAVGRGSVRTGASRLASPNNITLTQILGPIKVTISRRSNKGLNFYVAHFLSYDANGRAYRGRFE